MDASLVSIAIEVAKQGGFALLCFGLVFFYRQQSKERVLELKANSDRERLMTDKVLDLVGDVTRTVTANTAQLAAVQTELQGVRSSLHTLRNAHQTVHLLAEALTDEPGRIRLEMLDKGD